MKVAVYLLVFIVVTVFAAGNAFAGCDCKQPAYKDQLDWATRYMACLDDCFNNQMQQIRLEIQAVDQRMSDLDAEIDRLNLKIKNLESGGVPAEK
jgi:hypothetical protein